MEKILIIDSNSLLNRAFYAIPFLTTSKGVHTNGILGYLTMFFKVQDEFNAKYIIATFDKKAKTFRHLEYEDYKAGRYSMPQELVEQLYPLKQMLKAMNINIFELDGFEADDLIGTLSRIFEEKGFEPIIVTGDRDALQLCSDITKVIITKKGISDKEIYDTNKIMEVYGVTPNELIDVKAIMGDKSDNIPGVFGIGEKGAINLIKQYRSLENVYSNIDCMRDSKIKKSLIEHMDMAFLSKKLSKINRYVPIEFDFSKLSFYSDFDVEKVSKLYMEYELKSLLNRINFKVLDNTLNRDIEINIIDSAENLNELVERMDNANTIYLKCNLKGQKVSEIYFENIYLNFDNVSYLIDGYIIKENFDLISKIFSSNVKKVCFNSKVIYKVMFKYGKEVNNVCFDISLAEYLLNPGKEFNVVSLCNKYLQVSLSESDEDIGIHYFNEIYKTLMDKIVENNMENLYFEIEHPLSLVLAKIELQGFNVCIDTMNHLRDKFKLKIDEYSKNIYNLAGEEFNINSPKQLGKILFEKLDLPVIKKTKTGYSTNADVLDELIDKHDIIKEIINYRHITKLQSTYITGMIDMIDSDGKIHTSFNQTITSTGRLSSTDPNLQNIPIKYPLGREIRKIFIPDNGDCVILSADYSQIELRVLAHISKDKQMIDAFKNNLDIHKITASEIFYVDEDEVTPEMRNRCKAVNFGIVYGMSDFALAQDLKISKKEAKEYIDRYFNRYKGVKSYMEDVIDFSKEYGYVKTIFNRIRNINEIRSPNKILRSLGERLAMNTPIQGSAADIIKLAMIKVYRKLEEKGLKSTIILQVHDELVLNVYKDEIDVVSDIVRDEMETCYDEMLVPLCVNIAYGESWFEAK